MRIYLLAVLTGIFILQSCKKTEVPVRDELKNPGMVLKNLNNAEVKYQQSRTVDVNNDGSVDFVFYTQLLGDPILQRDRLQFIVISTIGRNLLNDVDDESPILNRSDLITKNHPGYTWYDFSSIVLAEKIITFSGNYWAGRWKNANHQYLPIQINDRTRLYHGWIELSFDSIPGKLILHKSALCTEADREVKAGQED